MTINERVSDSRIANLIEVLEFYMPGDKNLANNESELASALRELQQYRAAAELEVSDDELNAALTVHRLKTDGHSQLSDAFRAGYKYARRAAPQVTSVPDIEELRAAFETVERESRDNFNLSEMLTGNYEDEYTQQRWEAWLDCRAFITAPAVQAEQLSGNTEQVSQPTLPEGYLQGYKDGCEWSALMAEANHPQTGDWLFDDPIELAKAIRKGPDMLPAEPGNSPVIPEGWTGSDKANAALVMLDRIDTVDPVDDDRIEGIKRIIRELAAAPKQEANNG